VLAAALQRSAAAQPSRATAAGTRDHHLAGRLTGRLRPPVAHTGGSHRKWTDEWVPANQPPSVMPRQSFCCRSDRHRTPGGDAPIHYRNRSDWKAITLLPAERGGEGLSRDAGPSESS
jgi:hypothetical protein